MFEAAARTVDFAAAASDGMRRTRQGGRVALLRKLRGSLNWLF